MDAQAITIEAPQSLSFRALELHPLQPDDVLVSVHWSGVSAGTEKLLWTGAMPDFPGMGYPLVPGYEAVGRIVNAGYRHRSRIGQWVFVPGSQGFVGARGLFGGNASRLVLPGARALPISGSLGENAILMALAGTAMHAIAAGNPPELIIGHGVLGRLLARLTLASGALAPVVWDVNADRQTGGEGYTVIHPDADSNRDYKTVYDVSGAIGQLDNWIGRLCKGGEIVLAGFYREPVSFAFPPAFQREARLRIAAEWQPNDLEAVRALIESDALSLDGLITHHRPAAEAVDAYPQAFEDPHCLKMVLDWSEFAS